MSLDDGRLWFNLTCLQTSLVGHKIVTNSSLNDVVTNSSLNINMPGTREVLTDTTIFVCPVGDKVDFSDCVDHLLTRQSARQSRLWIVCRKGI